jgi:hypothetical protein
MTTPDVIEIQLPGGPPGPPGPAGPAGPAGATTLTDLTDVTGQGGAGQSPVDDGTSTFPLTRVTTEEDIEAILASVAAVDWHDIGAPDEPPFLSQFRNIGDPWSRCSYRILANSTVRLQGTVCCDDQTISDATWIPIFTLPPEARPGYNLEFSALTNDDAFSKLFIWETGEVIWGGYAIGAHAPITRLPLNFLSWSTAGPVATLANAIAARMPH